jgi:integrase/recombinase XerD
MLTIPYRRVGMDENGNHNKIRYLKLDELDRLLEAPALRSRTGLRNRCIMQLMTESGLRISEALSLKPRDISLEDKRVDVLRGKGHKPRTTYWRTDELSILIERWKLLRLDGGETLFCNVKGQDRGGQLSPHAFRKTFRAYVQRAGLDPGAVTPHTLRHTFATNTLRREKNLRVVQVALGHAWVSTTQIYTHVEPEDVSKAIRGY